MSTDDENHSPRLGCTKMSIKKIHPQTLNHEGCQASSVKMITNKEIQSPNYICACGCKNRECKEDIASKISACNQMQFSNSLCEDCKKALILNNEEVFLSDLDLSSETFYTKSASVQSQSISCGTYITPEECSTKLSTDEEIHSRSSSCDAHQVKMSTVDKNQIASLSFSDETLVTNVLPDSDHTMRPSQSPSSETCVACEIANKMLANEALLASRFNNRSFLKTVSNETQSLSCESPNPVPTESSVDEEIYSRSSVCEALLKSLLSTDDTHIAPPSYSDVRLSTSMPLSNQGQSLRCKNPIACEVSPSIMSFASSHSLCCKGHPLSEKCDTNSPNAQIRAMGALSPLDPSSYSRPELATIKHMSLNLYVDFESQVLRGQAKIDFDVLQNINNLILDASKLKIESIEAEDGTKLNYAMGDHLANMGSKLTISLPKQLTAGEEINEDFSIMTAEDILSKSSPKDDKSPYDKFSPTLPLTINGIVYEPTMGCSKSGVMFSREASSMYGCCDDNSATPYQGFRYTINIKYSTDPQASALQWLDPEQTSGKNHPYLFSQCQPIHARSIIPCQDTPAVKFTYDAEVTAPEEFTVLMSALRGEQKSNKTTFRQPMPLPSYLVALAVGVLESRTLGPRSKVWSEKEEIERSAWEFSETEKYLQAAERLCGPYEWTQYDLLVLPPSFPYGGMENPCLTFVTPTLLAGDRSQADVIVHEIMHSWTGNLVTNKNFEHFWLNEGFTVFLERKVGASLINDSVEAKRSRDFQSLLGLQELNEAINDVLGPTNPLTALVVKLDGVHPDDAFSTVPYEKGSLFLRYLENLSGGPEVFDDFLRAYLTKFRKKSLDTDQFQRFFLDYFKDNEALKNIDWDTWLYKAGMPPVIPAYDTTMTKAISAVLTKIKDPNTKLSHEDVETFTPHQMIHMLQQLIDSPPLSVDRLATLGTEYRVNGNKNTEILYRWLRLCIRSRDQSKVGEVFNFVNSQGRMKYVRPIYRDLYAWEDVRQQAIDNFLTNEKYMMHVSAYTLKKDLHLAETSSVAKE